MITSGGRITGLPKELATPSKLYLYRKLNPIASRFCAINGDIQKF